MTVEQFHLKRKPGRLMKNIDIKKTGLVIDSMCN